MTKLLNPHPCENQELSQGMPLTLSELSKPGYLQ